MSPANKLVIGLFGFGVVGEGIYQLLNATPSLQVTVKKICIKNKSKKRKAPPELFTTDAATILNDPEINVVVELISDADEAYAIVTTALRNKKAVVSANKKMIAEHLEALLSLQQEYHTPLLYEAAVCGSIPVIRNLEKYYDNDLLQGICGIVNGSTNFILTKVINNKLTYKEALLQAQQLGFAESDPALDVMGIDAVNKLTILLAHAYGIVTNPAQVLHKGITHIHSYDTTFAEEKGYAIKLVAQAKKLGNGKVAALVLPQFITNESMLWNVQEEYNGVVIESSFADKQFLYGKGAGRYPTSSAVLSDISALRYQYKYEYRKLNSHNHTLLADSFYLRVYVSFENWTDIEMADFNWIEEFYYQENRHYLIGVISFLKVQTLSWINKSHVSLILCPDGIIENIESRIVKKRSLELAGTTLKEAPTMLIEKLMLREK